MFDLFLALLVFQIARWISRLQNKLSDYFIPEMGLSLEMTEEHKIWLVWCWDWKCRCSKWKSVLVKRSPKTFVVLCIMYDLLVHVIMAPIFEEWFFRLWLEPLLFQYLQPLISCARFVSIMTISLLYAILHVTPNTPLSYNCVRITRCLCHAIVYSLFPSYCMCLHMGNNSEAFIRHWPIYICLMQQ